MSGKWARVSIRSFGHLLCHIAACSRNGSSRSERLAVSSSDLALHAALSGLVHPPVKGGVDGSIVARHPCVLLAVVVGADTVVVQVRRLERRDRGRERGGESHREGDRLREHSFFFKFLRGWAEVQLLYLPDQSTPERGSKCQGWPNAGGTEMPRRRHETAKYLGDWVAGGRLR